MKERPYIPQGYYGQLTDMYGRMGGFPALGPGPQASTIGGLASGFLSGPWNPFRTASFRGRRLFPGAQNPIQNFAGPTGRITGTVAQPNARMLPEVKAQNLGAGFARPIPRVPPRRPMPRRGLFSFGAK